MVKHCFSRHGGGRRTKGQRGVVTAEFALLLPVFILVIVGIVEFGHLWHLQHTITNASREGARAAIIYRSDYSSTNAQTTAETTVDTYLNNFLPHAGESKVWNTVVNAPDVYASGADLTVRVTTTEGLMLLDKLLPKSVSDLIVVEAQTTMKLE